MRKIFYHQQAGSKVCKTKTNSGASLSCRQAMRKWQRNRQFVCLTAVGGRQPEQILGCVVMSLAAPEAFLPPPFPSAAPMRCCISNVAVDGAFRQRGIARRMLRRCETIGGTLMPHC